MQRQRPEGKTLRNELQKQEPKAFFLSVSECENLGWRTTWHSVIWLSSKEWGRRRDK